MNLLTVEGISKSFGDKKIFENITFGIDEGDRTGLIGINGTGKSTLLKIVAGRETPDSGQVIRKNGLRVGYLPQTPTTSVNDWIEQHFPGARIVDVDVERNGTEVEIVDNGVKYEIWFDASSSWMQTKTEYDLRNIPDVVRNFVQTNYPDYRIDDAEKYETSSNGIYYHIEIEQGYQEKDIYLNAQGEEVERPTGIR